MSRFYRMNVEVTLVAPTREDVVKEAAQREWDLEDWYENETTTALCGNGHLTGGESEEEFSERLAKAIWKANGEFCAVEVTATYLENLSCETYQFDQDDYDRLQTSASSTS